MQKLKFWQGSKIGLILGVLIGCLLAIGLVYAYQYALDIPGNVIVEEAETSLEAYSDMAGTNKITSVNWGILRQGHASEKVIFIKNLGSETVSIFHKTSGPTGFDWQENTLLQTILPGELEGFPLWIRAHSDVPPGSYSFTHTFRSPIE